MRIKNCSLDLPQTNCKKYQKKGRKGNIQTAAPCTPMYLSYLLHLPDGCIYSTSTHATKCTILVMHVHMSKIFITCSKPVCCSEDKEISSTTTSKLIPQLLLCFLICVGLSLFYYHMPHVSCAKLLFLFLETAI